MVADLDTLSINCAEFIRDITRSGALLPVILISTHANVETVVAGIKNGAEDFIQKPLDGSKLIAAINRALTQVFVEQSDPLSRRRLVEHFALFIPRQVQVFDLVAKGLTSQTIGEKLELGVRTVETYRADVMLKMRADNVAVLVRQAIRLKRFVP